MRRNGHAKIGYYIGLLGLTLLLGSRLDAVALAQDKLPLTGDRSRGANSNSDDDLRNAAKVTLRFRDYPDLSNDYRINSDDTISVPVLGRMSIAGKTAAEFENQLAQDATRISGVAAAVTVEIAEYKPLYVTGYVNRAGAVQWQPGMPVVQAVALAGGLYRPGREQTAVADDVLAKIIDAQNRRLAAAARLRAEKAGESKLKAPKELATPAGTELIEQEAALMESRRIALSDQLAVLAKGRALSQREVQGLRTQAEQISAQLKVRRESGTRYEELKQKGLLLADKALEHEVRILDLEEKLTNISVAVARVEITIVNSERDSASLVRAHNSSVETDLVQVNREIAQASFDIEAARQLSGRQSSNDRGDVVTYAITRGPPRSRQRTDVVETSTVLPGDIVEVGTRPAGGRVSQDISSPVADSTK